MPLTTPSLHTERLLLRPFAEQDADAIYALQSNARVLRYWDSPPWTERSRADVFLAACRTMAEDGSGARFAIETRADHAFVGWCAMFRWNPVYRSLGVGYCFDEPAWGKGYATEATRAMLQWAYDTLDLNRVEAELDTRNAASARVLEKLGFVREGLRREDCIVSGEVSDSWIYGLLKRDWKAATSAAPAIHSEYASPAMSDAVFVRLSLTGDPSELDACRETHFAAEFDFNSVIPMPAELAIEESSAVTTGYDALYGDWTEPAKYWTWKDAAAALGLAFPLQSREELLACIRSLDCADMYLAPAQQYKENLEKYGHGSWYGWCKAHWGSKWNAEDSTVSTHLERTIVRFTVANAFPKKVIVALSKKWPGIAMQVQYADEHARWGKDCVLKNGREVQKFPGTPAAILQAIRHANDVDLGSATKRGAAPALSMS